MVGVSRRVLRPGGDLDPPAELAGMQPIEPPSATLAEALAAAASADERLLRLRGEYRVEPVAADHAFAEGGAVYFVVGGRSSHLIRTVPAPRADGLVHFHSWPDDRPMKPEAVGRLQEAARRQSVYLLEPKLPDTAERDLVIDMGAFTLLIDAAQRCGLIPGVATIIQIRDGEFRLGRHRQALAQMESMLQGFMVAISQRTQRLAREEIDIASGRVKMTPRELQMKRARDTQQTQAIDRAQTRFSRVVEGLRTLVQRGI